MKLRMFVRFRPRGRKLCASVWCKRFARAYTAEATRLFGVVRGKVNGWMRLWEREGKSEAEGLASRTAALPALDASLGNYNPAADSEPVSRPVAFAVRSVDAGSGTAVAGS